MRFLLDRVVLTAEERRMLNDLSFETNTPPGRVINKFIEFNRKQYLYRFEEKFLTAYNNALREYRAALR